MIFEVPKSYAPTVSHLHDRFFCSPQRVIAQARASRRLAIRPDAISVAIAHYNRGALAHLPLCNLLASDFVGEVVIMDDFSRPEELRALEEFVAALDVGDRVRVLRRNKNCGAQATKLDAVAAANREWVLILDSDNSAFPSLLSALSQLPLRRPLSIYCSPYAFPYFSFASFRGQVLDFEACVNLTRNGDLRRVFIINDGNYLVCRDDYLKTLGCLRELRSDVADVFVANYLWLSQGGRLEVLSHGIYHHRIDASSFWIRTAKESRQRVLTLFSRLENGIKWDGCFEKELLKDTMPTSRPCQSDSSQR